MARRWSPLLQNAPFDIAPGEMVVALVGGSGEGKIAAAMSARSAAGKFTLGRLRLMATG